jgi:uncharacterized protein
MMIHLPMRIDLARREVNGRDGLLYPIDRLERTTNALYFSRAGAQHPDIAYQERWLLPALGCVVIRWTMREGIEPFDCGWYIDLDGIEVTDEHWTVTDRYLDLIVFEGARYQVLDADELADAIETGEIALPDALDALRALNVLSVALRQHDNSVAALLAEHAPGLPG